MKNLILLCLILLCALQVTAGRIQRTEDTNDEHQALRYLIIYHLHISHIDNVITIHENYRRRTQPERSDTYKNYHACFSYNDTTIYYQITKDDCIDQSMEFLSKNPIKPLTPIKFEHTSNETISKFQAGFDF